MNEKKEGWEEDFEKKFLYWVVLGSTLNDGSALRWNVGEGKMPNIKDIKDFISQVRKEAYQEGQDDCCVEKLGCLCLGDEICRKKDCPCPEHYAKHEEWLEHMISKKRRQR